MFLCLELPSLLSCGNFVSVYAWERARCFRNFPICAQCDFYKAIKLILGKSAPENSDPWDLKEPVKADRDGKMMTEPSWLKWLWGGSCFSAHPPAHPCFLPLPLPFRTSQLSLVFISQLGWSKSARVSVFHLTETPLSNSPLWLFLKVLFLLYKL